MASNPVKYRKWLAGSSLASTRIGTVIIRAEAQPPSIRPVPGPPPADWSGAVKQLRDIAQWIIGGVIATAAGVVAGSSLTSVGQLDPATDRLRISLAIAGALLGFSAIALVLIRGLDVIAPSGGSLAKMAIATGRQPLVKARKRLYELHNYDETKHPLIDLLASQKSEDARKMLPNLYASASFSIIRCRFDRLMAWLCACVPVALFGFGLFAWAANPPPALPKPERGMTIKIVL